MNWFVERVQFIFIFICVNSPASDSYDETRFLLWFGWSANQQNQWNTNPGWYQFWLARFRLRMYFIVFLLELFNSIPPATSRLSVILLDVQFLQLCIREGHLHMCEPVQFFSPPAKHSEGAWFFIRIKSEDWALHAEQQLRWQNSLLSRKSSSPKQIFDPQSGNTNFHRVDAGAT